MKKTSKNIKEKINILCLILISFLISSCGNDITIGDQTWMKKNLSVDKFRNGDPIPKASNQEEWDKSYFEQKPAWCYVNDDSNTEKEYGKLYNWFAVNDPRGLAPEGYEIPTDKQWIKLQQELSGSNEPYNNSNDYRCSEEIRDKSGFAATISGIRQSALLKGEKGGFLFGKIGAYWSSSEYTSGLAYRISYTNYNNLVGNSFASFGNGMAVRCIKKEDKKGSNKEDSEKVNNKGSNTDASPDGNYTFEANQIKCEITISGDKYFGTNQMGNNIETLSGNISGENLLDSYGMNTVGHIGDGYITYGPYTLNKNN